MTLSLRGFEWRDFGLAKEVNGSAFIAKYRLKAASSVSSAMKSLEEDVVVCRQSDGQRTDNSE